jgi:hypothetical protein
MDDQHLTLAVTDSVQRHAILDHMLENSLIKHCFSTYIVTHTTLSAPVLMGMYIRR